MRLPCTSTFLPIVTALAHIRGPPPSPPSPACPLRSSPLTARASPQLQCTGSTHCLPVSRAWTGKGASPFIGLPSRRAVLPLRHSLPRCRPHIRFLPLLSSQAAQLIEKRMRPEVLLLVKIFLWLMSTVLGTLLLFGWRAVTRQFPFVRSFPRMPEEQRERCLRSWVTSRLYVFRTVFKVRGEREGGGEGRKALRFRLSGKAKCPLSPLAAADDCTAMASLQREYLLRGESL